MDPKSRLTQNFCCAKCRGKKALLRTTTLRASSLMQALKEGSAPSYHILTCALCGYTELYDTRIYATAAEPTTDQILSENT